MDFSIQETYHLDVSLDSASLRDALRALGAVLEDRGHAVELAVVGGGALLMLGLIRRPTKDLDVVARVEAGSWLHAEPFPQPLAEAVRDVALALGAELGDG